MNNDELYHYGVPGMRWGQKKAQPIQGQNMRGSAKQPTTNIKRTTKPKTSNSSNKKTKLTAEQKAQIKEEKAQAKAERKAQAFKRGLIAAGIALAVIGGIALARKMSGANNVQPEVAKKVSKGKEKVSKFKNAKVKKGTTDQFQKEFMKNSMKQREQYAKIMKQNTKAANKAAKASAKASKKALKEAMKRQKNSGFKLGPIYRTKIDW